MLRKKPENRHASTFLKNNRAAEKNAFTHFESAAIRFNHHTWRQNIFLYHVESLTSRLHMLILRLPAVIADLWLFNEQHKLYSSVFIILRPNQVNCRFSGELNQNVHSKMVTVNSYHNKNERLFSHQQTVCILSHNETCHDDIPLIYGWLF